MLISYACPVADWTCVQAGGTEGWVMTQFLVSSKPGKYEITERADNFRTVAAFDVIAKALNGKTDRSVCLRERPNKTSGAIRRLTAGDQLQVLAMGMVWDKVVDLDTGLIGYVANDYMDRM